MPLGVDYVPTGVYVKGEMRLRTGRCRSLSGDDDNNRGGRTSGGGTRDKGLLREET